MLTMLKMPTNPADANDAVVGGDGDGVHLMDTTIILASNLTLYLFVLEVLLWAKEEKWCAKFK